MIVVINNLVLTLNDLTFNSIQFKNVTVIIIIPIPIPIPIPILFYSYFIHILFIFYSYFIHILFIFYSYFFHIFEGRAGLGGSIDFSREGLRFHEIT